MAAYDLEEQERIDALKDWWDKWGNWVYAAVAMFFAGVAGTQLWKNYQGKQHEEAEVLFKSVTKASQESIASRDPKKLTEAAALMADKYPKSFQATEARLMAAKSEFEAGKLDEAAKHLQWVVDHGRDAFRPIARVRLAQVLLDQKKFDEALQQLERVKDTGYIALVADVRGDVLSAQGKKAEAREAYQLAVDKADERSPVKFVSQSKLDALGGSTKPAEPAKGGKS
ncbi:MAG: tetratricopeptide repeat protein [Betaproteobacteria bacterium]|nr:tetratricopeptide repeat protein [Betaproteobacteria bacterium]